VIVLKQCHGLLVFHPEDLYVCGYLTAQTGSAIYIKISVWICGFVQEIQQHTYPG